MPKPSQTTARSRQKRPRTAGSEDFSQWLDKNERSPIAGFGELSALMTFAHSPGYFCPAVAIQIFHLLSLLLALFLQKHWGCSLALEWLPDAGMRYTIINQLIYSIGDRGCSLVYSCLVCRQSPSFTWLHPSHHLQGDEETHCHLLKQNTGKRATQWLMRAQGLYKPIRPKKDINTNTKNLKML